MEVEVLGKRYVSKKVKELDNRMGELFSDCQERTARSFDGTKIAYRITGEGLPLVISPGVFTSYMFFHDMKDYFKQKHTVILWDYRGHAPSEVPSDLSTLTIPNHARDLKYVLDDAGIDKAILIGFSMGVMTILEAFRQYPERVYGLVPIDGPYTEGYGALTSSKAGQKIFIRTLRFLSSNPWLVEWVKPVILTPINMPVAKRVELNPTLAPKDEMKLYFDYIAKMDWHAGFQALALMGEYDGSDILDKVNVPTLIICGEKDSWTPKRISDEMHEKIKGSEYTIIPGGSHATPAENPDMINYRIDLWLRNYFHELVEAGHNYQPTKAKSTTNRKAEKRSGRKALAKGR
ncbi:MAG: alpha/beta hydrolase [Actinomycetota bacterium]|nr:alpha/beta hydrolase [Actinomycetota bacterium]